MQIGIKVSLFNYKMREARLERGLTQQQFADLIGTSAQYISKIETLQRPPLREWGCIELLDKIAVELGFEIEELFDSDYLELIIKQNVFKGETWSTIYFTYKNKLSNLISSNLKNTMLLKDGLDVIDNEIDLANLKNKLTEYLLDLPEREAKVLQLKFGLDKYNPHTYKQIAKKLGVTPERVRQIHDQGLRRFRNPWFTRELREYL